MQCNHEEKVFSTSFCVGDIKETKVSRYYDCPKCGKVIIERETVSLEELIENLSKRIIKVEVK